MSKTYDEPDATATTVEAMGKVMEAMTAVNEAVAGQRAQLERLGYSPTAAEQMSQVLYANMVGMIFQRGQQ